MRITIAILLTLVALSVTAQNWMFYRGEDEPVDLKTGLVSCLEMQDDGVSQTHLHDASGNLDAEIHGTLYYKQPGMTTLNPYSIWFNGDDGNFAKLVLAGRDTFSVSMWIKSNFSNITDGNRLFGHAYDGFEATLGGSGGVGVYDGSWRYSGVFIQSNTWSHLVIIKSLDGYSIYLNGVREYYAASTRTMTDNCYIMSRYTSDHSAQGYIMQFSYWWRPLSQGDINELYNNGLGKKYINW